MMTLLFDFYPAIFLQEYRIHVKGVFHKFIKRLKIPAVKSKRYVCADIFGVING